jgi:hypothetical protein
VAAWFGRWPRWSELERGQKIGVIGLGATVLFGLWGIGATNEWFRGGDDGTASPGNSATHATSTTTEPVESTTTSIIAAEFEFEPLSFQSPEELREGESHVFFDSDGSGLTIQISSIDDELHVVASITAFLAGEEVCRWLEVGAASGPLVYRGGGTEYVITVDVPYSFLAEVRVAKRISGEPSGTETCEPQASGD